MSIPGHRELVGLRLHDQTRRVPGHAVRGEVHQLVQANVSNVSNITNVSNVSNITNVSNVSNVKR